MVRVFSCKPQLSLDMDTTTDRSHSTQLDLTHIGPKSFESLDLPTRRRQIFPAAPPSSPRHSMVQQWPQYRNTTPVFPLFEDGWITQFTHPAQTITLSTNQLTPVTDTQFPSPSHDDQQTTYTCPSDCCACGANRSTQSDSWSQGCSSCSGEDTVMDERKRNDEGRSCGYGFSHNRRVSENAVLREPPAYHRSRSPLDLRMPRVSSRLPPQPTIRRSNASRCQPPAYDLPDLSANTPPPSYPLLSHPFHTAFQPSTAPFLDPNQCSFMIFDDSDTDTREKRGSKARSLSRCLDQKREGEAKRRFRHSISEVFSALSCSR